MKLHRGLLRVGLASLKGPIAIVSAIGLAIVACWVAQALLVAYALALVLRGGDLSDLVGPIAGLLCVVAVRAALVWGRDVAAQWAGLIVKQRIRRRLFEHILDLGPAHSTARRTGALQSVLVDGVEGLQAYYAYYLSQAVVVFAASTGILLYLATITPLVAGVLAAFVVVVPIAPKLWNRRLARRGDSHWESYKEVESDYVDAIQGMATLKSLDAVANYRRRLEQRTWRLYRRTMRQLAVSLVGTSLTTLLMGVGSAVAVVVATVELVAGRLTPTQLFIVLLLSRECFRPLTDLAGYWHMSYLGFSAGNEVTALLAAPRPRVRARTVPRHAPATSPGVTISFRGVDFTYPGRERPAVAGFDLRIAGGETVALVGSSGAGKTTVLNLLLGFLRPAGGTIEVAGWDIRDMTPDELHRLVTLVPQDPYVFHGTVEDNIRLGRPDASAAEVRHAAEIADIARFVDGAEAGYRTPVGERGMTLSSGQRQRLAIARAVLRDSPALLLDEATANLDGESEATVVRALAGMAGARTTIIVAHRMSTVRAADRVVVLTDGEIAESGRHEELVRTSGLYRRMVHIEQDARAGGAV